MNIDSSAPLQAQKEIIINARVERVWKVLTMINAWPVWQKNITSAQLEGELKAGSQFRWKVGGMNIVSTLQEVDENTLISWTGVVLGMQAVHIWEFQKIGNTTKVITKESLVGWLPVVIKIFQPDFLKDSLKKTLESLKNYAEKEI